MLKMPVRLYQISEMIEMLSSLETIDARRKFLLNNVNDSVFLRVLKLIYDKDVKKCISSLPKNYKPVNPEQLLENTYMQIRSNIKEYEHILLNPKLLNKNRAVKMYMILENAHRDEIAVLEMIIDKKKVIKGVPVKLIEECFPNLLETPLEK